MPDVDPAITQRVPVNDDGTLAIGITRVTVYPLDEDGVPTMGEAQDVPATRVMVDQPTHWIPTPQGWITNGLVAGTAWLDRSRVWGTRPYRVAMGQAAAAHVVYQAQNDPQAYERRTITVTTTGETTEEPTEGDGESQARPAPIMSFDSERRDNGDLILHAHKLRYLRNDDAILDATYGRGAMWRRWAPLNAALTTNDLDPDALSDLHNDFRMLPFANDRFDAVVFDPPYKLNGTPTNTGGIDERYGVDTCTRWQDRYALIEDGLIECARVCRRHLLVKCMNQVVSGRMRFQTHDFTQHVERYTGFRLCDELHLPSYRPQPEGRRQVHARSNYSTLLVFTKRFRRGHGGPYEPHFAFNGGTDWRLVRPYGFPAQGS